MTRFVGIRQKFAISGAQGELKGYLHMDENPDGTLAMISIEIHKEGTMARAMAQSFASAVNMGLEAGVPIRAFVEEFRGTRFEPSGEVKGSPSITTCTSLLDYVVQELEATYLVKE
jgi:ribonucleoside-diphosphate reductase alpha chain